MGKKYKELDRQEALLKFLLSVPRDVNNQITFGTNRYSTIPKFKPDEVVQTLTTLSNAGYIDAYFYGHPSTETACRIKLNEAAITYFEVQKLDEENLRDDRWHDYKVAAFGAIIGFILTKIGESIISLF